MRWVGHVACMSEINSYNIEVRKPRGESPLGLCVNGKIILKWILKTGQKGVNWINFTQDSN
jgi:hypothetical protein